MIPSPIARVLSTLASHQVRFLLMGGQACIVYGAAEFSRDIDLCIHIHAANLERLRAALSELEAEPVYVPELSADFLERGHACHFRCGLAEVRGLRIDVMGRMRGVEPWACVWRRRREITVPGLGRMPLLALPDLVLAKKTQRDKDWPMIRRLVEADIFGSQSHASTAQIEFWLRECRTPELLVSLCSAHRKAARALTRVRTVLEPALQGDLLAVRRTLIEEEESERERDREFWKPLKEELEVLRRQRRRPRPADTSRARSP